MPKINSIDCRQLFELRNEVPLVDVRSESEFSSGHIPGAANIPLLRDEDRKIVGTDYKQRGRAEAIRSGFRLVGPRLADMVDQAIAMAEGKELVIHCWRGGMRSSNFAQFVGMAGIGSWILSGGYKSYRQEAQHYFQKPFQLILLSGCTGSGKSEVLRALHEKGEQILDLEKLANHKGSAFGGLMMPPQPTTEQFENLLFEEIRTLNVEKPVWVEDESIAVGRVFIPSSFWTTMRRSPVVMLNLDKSVRIQRLVDEYGPADRDEFLEAMTKITKKLGGQHFKTAKEKLEQDQMPEVMEILLTYYDKAYTNSMQRRNPENRGAVDWDGKNANRAAEDLIQLSKQTTSY